MKAFETNAPVIVWPDGGLLHRITFAILFRDSPLRIRFLVDLFLAIRSVSPPNSLLETL